jgi:hypothetical protein
VFVTADHHVLAGPAYQVVFAGQAEDPVAVTLAHQVVGAVGSLQEVAMICADLVHRQSYPACHQQAQGHGGEQ